MSHHVVNPDSWPRPRGYANGIIADAGRYFAIAGQIGWNERNELVSSDFYEQAARALRNVLAVLRAGGGKPEDVVRLTWYVTDKREYTAAAKSLGECYRDLFGDSYPAMSLVQVAALLEDGAKVEIEATAVLAP
ncbi:MAG: RidA family protein [Vulcanimicrobiaceae bacterium]